MIRPTNLLRGGFGRLRRRLVGLNMVQDPLAGGGLFFFLPALGSRQLKAFPDLVTLVPQHSPEVAKSGFQSQASSHQQHRKEDDEGTARIECIGEKVGHQNSDHAAGGHGLATPGDVLDQELEHGG